MADVYRHGVYVQEASSDLVVMSRQSGGLIMAVGTSPIRQATTPVAANEPVLCSTYNEAVSRLGYSTDTGKYTLCEAMDVLFGLYQVAPVVFVNVFDPTTHKTEHERELHQVTADHKVSIDGDVIGTIKTETMTTDGSDETWTDISANATVTTQTTDTTVLTLPETYTLGARVYLTYDEPDASRVSGDMVAGSYNSITGASTGLELVSEVYSRFGQTIGTIIAPGWSHLPNVMLKMAGKAELVNGHFSAVAIADLNSTAIGGYGQAYTWKTSNGYAHPHLIACYPAVKYGNAMQHMSTHLAGRMARQTADDGDVPYRSPSNRSALISGMCNLDGSANYFGEEAACVLNGGGIVTVTNFNGWRFWGNNTSAYPGTSDPKDRWIAVRRMFNFVKEALTLRFWSQLGEPITRRQIDSIIDSANTYLNGLTNMGALLGGRVECLEEDNSASDLADGKVSFRVYVTPPSPARELMFTMQYDAEYLGEIF